MIGMLNRNLHTQSPAIHATAIVATNPSPFRKLGGGPGDARNISDRTGVRYERSQATPMATATASIEPVA